MIDIPSPGMLLVITVSIFICSALWSVLSSIGTWCLSPVVEYIADLNEIVDMHRMKKGARNGMFGERRGPSSIRIKNNIVNCEDDGIPVPRTCDPNAQMPLPHYTSTCMSMK